jgi:hypothetical protein
MDVLWFFPVTCVKEEAVMDQLSAPMALNIKRPLQDGQAVGWQIADRPGYLLVQGQETLPELPGT